MAIDGIRFVYGKPALVIGTGGQKTLAVGDLHIGLERKLRKSGIRLYGTAERMARDIIGIADEFRAKRIAVLGDIKDTLFYPDTSDRNSIRRFLYLLRDYDVSLIRGNHDAHLDEMGLELHDELLLGRFALLHGNSWPSSKAMLKDYVITAHNHAAVSFMDSNGALYREKAWVISDVAKRNAAKRYPRFNGNARLVMMPAFNGLILGLEVRDLRDANTSPLLKNRIFDYRRGRTYTLRGEIIGAAARHAPGNRQRSSMGKPL